MKKLILLCVIFLFGSISAEAQQKINFQNPKTLADNQRSDTIDILNYTINLNITDFTNKIIGGNTVIRFAPKMNTVNTISLDLLRLTVDSITMNNQLVTYHYNDTLIVAQLPSTENIGDTNNLTIYYHGTPQMDASGWGGFYFQNGIAYNLGVGFDANPHNYGRVWYPCFDNFVERATYIFNITTNNGNIAYCNGYLKSDTTDISGLRTRTWELDKSIPSYLASVDVGKYTQVNEVYNGINGPIPIVLAALPADTINLKNSFVHLKNALAGFENRYGYYRWNKVGYSLVPFTSGAMEHATNIAFPALAANGTTTYEADIMAHELSHHWFGDLVTCQTAGDMWLNEGMAVYSQSIFTEWVYGTNAYKASIRTNHENVLHYAHIIDHSYRALYNIPLAYTYGYTVYQKGADVAHTLRGYMGDSTFFAGLKYYLNTNQYTAVNSYTLMNSLQTSSGMNLSDFFNGWVFNPGFPQFSIDSFKVVPVSGNYTVTVFVKQKLTGAPAYFNNVPLQISFKDKMWNDIDQKIIVSGHLSTFTFTLPINPIFIGLNMDEKISEAIAPQTATIKATGTYNLSNARMSITVTNITDSAFIFVEHNYTAPDSIKNNPMHYRISPNRYWKVSGIIPNGYTATAQMYFDGRKVSSGGGGYLDTALTIHGSDSIILLYRKNPASDWTQYPAYSKVIVGGPTLGFGYVKLDSLPMGEYTFADGVSTLGIKELKKSSGTIQVYPNPANKTISFDLKDESQLQSKKFSVINAAGKIIFRGNLKQGQTNYSVSAEDWKNGIYFISIPVDDQHYLTGKFDVIH
ncbi:MAG: M1 family aminopeptidase [Bacteroidia bacterium]